jgi:hypothetical protein
MTGWPFDQGPNVAAVTCRTILGGAPILVVIHYSDDHSWAFMDGVTWETEEGALVAMKEIVRLDPTVVEVADLPPGWRARRTSVGSPWARSVAPGC